MNRICLQCDGKHEHLPWGVDMRSGQFATALKVSYPNKLCQQVAMCVKDFAQERGVRLEPLTRGRRDHTSKQMTSAAELSPRRALPR